MTSHLDIADAVELATAWAAWLGTDLDIRVIVLKGDTLARQGLRARHTSSDADVLVEPARFDAYCAALEAAGWMPRPMPFISSQISPHSVTYLHAEWPCDIDVHRRFPGFLADDATVFESLWERRTLLRFAELRVPVPDRLAGILVMGLHAMRDGTVNPRHRADLDSLATIELTDDERDDLGELARATGSDGSLAPTLRALGVDVDPTDSAELRAWRARVASSSHGAYAWLLLLRSTPWRSRPGVIARAFWPRDIDILLAHPETPARFFPLLGARGRRMLRGIRGIPQSVRALRAR